MAATQPAAAPGVDPMAKARDLVVLQRRKKALDAQLGDVETRIKQLKTEMQTLIEDDQFPDKARVDGASVFLWRQIWAGPAGGDHDRLTAVLGELGLHEYQPTKVNTQSLSAYVREALADAPLFSDDGSILTLEERARLVLPASLVAALSLTEKRDVRVNGA